MLALFDFSNRLTRVQTNISDMQQSLRVAQNDSVRLIRMAGRGGLPLGNLPDGTAVAVRQQRGGRHPHRRRHHPRGRPRLGRADRPRGLRGADLSGQDGRHRRVHPQPPGRADERHDHHRQQDAHRRSRRIWRRSRTRSTSSGRRPCCWSAARAPTSGPWSSWTRRTRTSRTRASSPSAFKITVGTHTSDYLKFSSAGAGRLSAQAEEPPASSACSRSTGSTSAGSYAISGDKTSDLAPKLSRARVYPGTQAVWDDDDENWQADIADNIFDFQVALGLDTPAKDPTAGACAAGTIQSDDKHCGIYESADGETDDWMYNGEANTDPALFAGSTLYYIRLSTLARTDRRDKDYQAPTLVRVEDNKYDKPETTVFNSDEERMYRRRILRTVIDMRNLG